MAHFGCTIAGTSGMTAHVDFQPGVTADFVLTHDP